MGSVSPHPHTQATFRMPAILELNNVTFAFIAGTASDIQYSATGGSDDWARGVAGIKWVYLVELPGKGHGFLVPPRSVFQIVSRKRNLTSFHFRHILPVARSNLEGLRNLVTEIYKRL